MFSEFFLKRPRFAIVISIIMCIAGIVSIKQLPVALYPEITPPVVKVRANYPGASADVIAKTVAIPIEKEVNGVEDMLYMESSSQDTVYELTVTFKTGVDPDMAQVKVQNRVQIASASLPEEVSRQGVTVTRESTNMLAMISFASPDLSVDKLKISDFVIDNVKQSLARVEGVGGVQIYASNSSMRVWLNSDKMAQLGLTASDIRVAISSQNYQPSLGKLGAAPNENAQMIYPLKTLGRINEVEDFKNIIVRTAEHGGLVRLKDIARVEIGEENYGITAYANNKDAVALMVNLSSGANALDCIKKVRNELKRLEQYMPKGVEYHINFDSTDYINASIHEVVETLVETFLLVVLVCWIFLQNWRTTLVPSIAIPVSLLATFGVMLACGYSINMFTLFGLVLAIGSVVDDAIVVVERVAVLMNDENMEPMDATRKTMKEVSGALVATTLVMVAIFVPIACMGGITGRIYQQFAITISTALCFSTLNALTLSPVLCSTILKRYTVPKHGPFAWFNSILHRSNKYYTRATALFARKVAVIAIFFFVILGINGALFKVSGTSFVPNEDQGVYVVDVALPEGASFSRTRDAIQSMTKDILKDFGDKGGVKDTTTVAGVSIIGGRAENAGLIIVGLKNWEIRKSPDKYSTTMMTQRCTQLKASYPGANINCFEFPAIMGLGSQGGMDFRLQMVDGMDYTKLDNAATKFLGAVNSEYAYFKYGFTTFTSKTPAMYIEINREKAEALNVPVGTIYSTLEAYLGSMYVNDINFGTQVNKVVVQSDALFRDNVDSLNKIYVQSTSGQEVPLGSLISLRKVMSPRVITRYNQFPSATINAMQSDSVSSGEAMSKMESLMKMFHGDFTFDWSSMSWQEKNNQGQIIILVTLAVLFAYLFLVAQYESWTLPLSVLMSVSVASAGALAGLIFTGLPLSIYSQLGIVLLVGLASKNAILIVEFARDAHSTKSIAASAIYALKERFRPVLMTALTFVLGVWPMLIANGAGANSRRAIGTPVFWGMLFGTFIGLFIIPLLYVLVQTLTEKFSKKNVSNK
ncbi:MAG: efflux RND transporter permease subunit [Alphaproteobacteria bacterium]|nr:efflux RND transporter permease subunit [Alphaproteobacteria bacterium]